MGLKTTTQPYPANENDKNEAEKAKVLVVFCPPRDLKSGEYPSGTLRSVAF